MACWPPERKGEKKKRNRRSSACSALSPPEKGGERKKKGIRGLGLGPQQIIAVSSSASWARRGGEKGGKVKKRKDRRLWWFAETFERRGTRVLEKREKGEGRDILSLIPFSSYPVPRRGRKGGGGDDRKNVSTVSLKTNPLPIEGGRKTLKREEKMDGMPRFSVLYPSSFLNPGRRGYSKRKKSL